MIISDINFISELSDTESSITGAGKKHGKKHGGKPPVEPPPEKPPYYKWGKWGYGGYGGYKSVDVAVAVANTEVAAVGGFIAIAKGEANAVAIA